MASTTVCGISFVALVAFVTVASGRGLPVHVMDFVNDVDAEGEIHAVLVAGSNTWGNYRHQSDMLHAYQVLVDHGVKKDNIITMFYDDLAESAFNPTKGVVINSPYNDRNVYEGVNKDYTGKEVTPSNFVAILEGQADKVKGGTGRVLKSGPKDRVFINFVDHGGPGIIAFPTEIMHAEELNKALTYMHENNMYNQLVFYMEACESGSMFNKLLSDSINIYATTASNPTTSSYACYYDKKLRTYLGDVYSVNWLENSDKADLTKETLKQQYHIVEKETNTSKVCEYGDITSFTSLPAGDFLGSNATTASSAHIKERFVDAIDSRDVDIGILTHMIADEPSAERREQYRLELQTIFERREQINSMFKNVIRAAAGEDKVDFHMNNKVEPTKFGCTRPAIDAMHNSCVNFAKEPYATKIAFSLVSMCENGVDVQKIVEATKTCKFVSGVY